MRLQKLTASRSVRRKIFRRVRWLLPREWENCWLLRTHGGYKLCFKFHHENYGIALGEYNIELRMQITQNNWHRFSEQWATVAAGQFITQKLGEKSFFEQVMPMTPVDPVARKKKADADAEHDRKIKYMRQQHEAERQHLAEKELRWREYILGHWRDSGVRLDSVLFTSQLAAMFGDR